MTQSHSDGEPRRLSLDARYAIRDLSKQIIKDKRSSEESILRVALAEAYELGFADGLNSQKEIADGFPQA